MFTGSLKWPQRRHLADIPDPPGKPEITDYDNKSVDLKWREPKSDNGAKIEKYIVEKRNKKTGDWEKVGEVSNLQDIMGSQQVDTGYGTTFWEWCVKNIHST